MKTLTLLFSFLALVISLWLVVLHIQPQPQEGWSEEKKLAYIYIILPEDNTVFDANGPTFFCDTETHILMVRNAFFGLHLPYKNVRGRTEMCQYMLEMYEMPMARKQRT